MFPMVIPAFLLLTYGLLPSLVDAKNFKVEQRRLALVSQVRRQSGISWSTKQNKIATVNRRYDTTKTGPLEEQINALLLECRRRGCTPPQKVRKTYEALKSPVAYKTRGSDFVERNLRNVLQQFRDSLNGRLDNAVASKIQRANARRVQKETQLAKQLSRKTEQNRQYAQRRKAQAKRAEQQAESQRRKQAVQRRKEQEQRAEQRRKAQKQREFKAREAEMATLERKIESLKQLRRDALKQKRHDLVRRVDETIAEKRGKHTELLMKIMYDSYDPNE